MNTKNIKTAVIVLLAAANIFFIYNIAGLNRRLQNLPAGMIENAAAILKAHGIEADIKKIPAGKPDNYIYEGIYSEERYGEIVRSFSGASDDEIAEGSSMILGKGAAYNVGEYKFRFEDNMQVEIVRDNYRDSVGGDEIDMLAGYGGFGRSDANRAERIIKDFLKKYPEQDERTGFRITALRRAGADSEEILINQTADNFLISGHAVYIIIDGGEIKYFSGHWYFGAFTKRYEMPLLDSVNILFKNLEHDGGALAGARLENMDREYNILKQHGIDIFYLTPSWVISFDGGRKFSYDMMTGNKNG